MPLWDIQVWVGWFEDSLFVVVGFGNFVGGDFSVLVQGMAFACALGSILMVRVLVPCFVVSCSVVKKAVWPSVALPVSRVPSLGKVEVMLLDCRGCVGMISVLS